ncbi:tyrosine 3-monooxygenase isoform X1 [Anopheles arabiensis]|uniref:Tyrosine 3-monooxygenase n=1 Tax=Anopheles arabiensis TaxID=7173 RepID=A0A453YIY2_ANOAR|nr:tyrosine 3-monooxygenase isoform X1 [Anopheles arabiensis]XP_040222100.2 tyrosine 3-monooxygenase isoform X2 [Anopheles coluzzii]
MHTSAAPVMSIQIFQIFLEECDENGYPSRRRSLVDDARFETIVVKQTKQTVLDEARAKANDSSLECTILQAQEQHQQEDKIPQEVQQTVEDQNDDEEEIRMVAVDELPQKPQEHVPSADDEDKETDAGLTEEEVVLQNAASESPEAEKEVVRAAVVVRLRDGMGSLGRILKAVEAYHGTVVHLESRQSRSEGVQFDVLVKVDMARANLLQLIRSLRQTQSFGSVSLLSENNVNVKAPWFPKHASELDNCNHLMTKYEPDLDMNHPGFADQVYRARRKEIAEIAFAYRYGDPIPHIDYTETENKTWAAVFGRVKELMVQHACSEYIAVFRKLEDEKIFVKERLPQLQEMSDFLRKNTGFTLRPAAGLLTARDFLASLAFRIFQSTQYVRHINSPYHTPEPDCIHELLGHMPLLADPSFAQFSQEIGLASLGASDEEIEKLSTVYWFTVEFGLCKEKDEVKAYGAGLLSAYGELLHAISDKPEHRPFEPASTAVQPYQDQEYQPIYYVAESFEDAKEKFRRWVSTMSRPFEVRFNPHTERVEVLDSVDKLETLVSQLNTEVLHLTNAIAKLKQPFC